MYLFTQRSAERVPSANRNVFLSSDKSELWKRSEQLEFDMKTRLSDTWVEDKSVAHCPQCKTEFTLFVRKVYIVIRVFFVSQLHVIFNVFKVRYISLFVFSLCPNSL